MDAADRIPDDFEGFTAAEAVAVLGRRMPIPSSLLTDLRRLRRENRELYHLDQIDELRRKAEAHPGAVWFRAQENITRHLKAIEQMQGITP